MNILSVYSMSEFKLFSNPSNYIVPLNRVIFEYALIYEYIIATFQEDLQSFRHFLAFKYIGQHELDIVCKTLISPCSTCMILRMIRPSVFG